MIKIQGESPGTASIDCRQSLIRKNLKFSVYRSRWEQQYFQDGSTIGSTRNKRHFAYFKWQYCCSLHFWIQRKILGIFCSLFPIPEVNRFWDIWIQKSCLLSLEYQLFFPHGSNFCIKSLKPFLILIFFPDQ